MPELRTTDFPATAQVSICMVYDTAMKRIPDSLGAAVFIAQRLISRQVMDIADPPQPRREKILHKVKLKKEEPAMTTVYVP